MRPALVACLLAVGVGAAYADGLPGKERREFWDWLLEPHRAEVALILAKVRENRAKVTDAYSEATPFDPPTGMFSPERSALRDALLADAEGMLRYALKLAPGDVVLERELALVLDENERPTAQAALERYLRDEVPERVTADARVRLARWYARQRRYGEAIVQLRLALGQGGADPRSRATALVLLASVYMNTGRLAEAIDLLGGAGSATPLYGDVMPSFALAVAYDRDEQVTLAHDTIQRMLIARPDALFYALHDDTGTRNPLVPAYERHYFAALQHEALGHLPEARTEWLAYARTPDAPYRGRARQHLAAVEEMLRAKRRAPAPKPPRVPVAAPPWQTPGWHGP